MIFTAALLAAAVPTAAKPAAKPHTEKIDKSSNAKAEDFNPAQILSMFDKIFPKQPDPAPARLALSEVSVQTLFPNGTYGRMMDGMMSGMVDRFLNMSEADCEDGLSARGRFLRPCEHSHTRFETYVGNTGGSQVCASQWGQLEFLFC